MEYQEEISENLTQEIDLNKSNKFKINVGIFRRKPYDPLIYKIGRKNLKKFFTPKFSKHVVIYFKFVVKCFFFT